MRKYHLYQANYTRDSFCYEKDSTDIGQGEVVKTMLDGGYPFVAELSAQSLSDAYMMTQNVGDSWIKGSNIMGIGHGFEQGARSTSVGDVIHDVDKNTFYIVAGVGFDKIDFAALMGNK